MFLSKLKDLGDFVSKGKKNLDITSIQNQLGTSFFDVMEKSFIARQVDISNSSFGETDVDSIINGYGQKNMIAAAATSMIPGPLGILGSIPELILNMGNQMYMIYDLGCAFDKEAFLNKDLLLDIPFAAIGGNTNLALIQNNATDLLDSPTQVLQNKSMDLGKTMVERTLKKSIVQFIPVAGPVVMGIWSKMTTAKIAKSSKGFFNSAAEYTEHFKKEETVEISRTLQIQKIKALANLIECNDEINEGQIAFLGPIIENADVPQSQKNHLLEESLKVGSNFQLDYDLLKDYEEDENLLFELIVMAKRSGSLDQLELKYIHQVADQLNLDHSLVNDLID